ncbi:MAG: hypothetical protein ABSG41_22345 [Bryobacteraceae bacterium]|jgi:hypothetical protein
MAGVDIISVAITLFAVAAAPLFTSARFTRLEERRPKAYSTRALNGLRAHVE